MEKSAVLAKVDFAEEAVKKLVRRLSEKAAKLIFCYEARPTINGDGIAAGHKGGAVSRNCSRRCVDLDIGAPERWLLVECGSPLFVKELRNA